LHGQRGDREADGERDSERIGATELSDAAPEAESIAIAIVIIVILRHSESVGGCDSSELVLRTIESRGF